MKNNNSSIASFFGWMFHGCWHHYNEWSQPKKGYGQIVYQEKECLKCGRVQQRRISGNGGASRKGGAKPAKPSKLPNTENTPPPPAGQSGESAS